MTISSPSQPDGWTFRRVVWATLVLVFVALGFWLLYRFNQVVFLLLVAIMLGTVIRPVVTWLNRRGLPRMPGVMLVFFLLLVLLAGFVLLAFPLIVAQATTIAAAMPGYYHGLRGGMAAYPNQWIVRLSTFLPAELPGLASLPSTGQVTMASAGQAWGYVVSAANIIFGGIILLLLAFYWTLDGPRIIQSFLPFVPTGQRESIGELISAMESKVGFYIAGQVILCLAIFIMALMAYLLIGLPNVLVLALLAGVLEAVPLVGPLLGVIPAAMVALSIGPDKLFWVIGATLVIQSIENYLLAPPVMRRAVGVNPFVSLLAIFAFGSLLGLGGMLMAVPMAAIIQLLLDRFVFHKGSLESEDSPGRDLASRLRYEAEELARGLQKQARFKKGGSAQRVKQMDQVLDEIETITTDLDALLAQVHTSGTP
jgi:predicted PurR-regulated permease PerM